MKSKSLVLMAVALVALMALMAGCTMTDKSTTEVFDNGTDPATVALGWIKDHNVTIDPGSLSVPMHGSAMTRENNGAVLYWVYSHDYRFEYTNNSTPEYVDITICGTPYGGKWDVSYAMQNAHWDLIKGKDINTELADVPKKPTSTPTPIPTPDPLGRATAVVP